jgi:hypothetical protein
MAITNIPDYTTLPGNVLLNIFSFLPQQDLATTERVCTQWKNVANVDSAWEYVCQKYLDKPCPFNGLWKERARVFGNWRHRCATITSFPPRRAGPTVCEHYATLSKDKTPLIVDCDIDSVTVSDLRTRKEVQKILLSSEKCRTRIYSSPKFNVNGTTMCYLNLEGEVVSVDLETGQTTALTSVIPDLHENRNICYEIYRTDQEIITNIVYSYDRSQKIHIWDAQAGIWKPSICSDADNYWCSVRSTPNFIVCLDLSCTIVAFSRRDGSRQDLGNTRYLFKENTIDSSGSYFAYVSLDGEVKVFKDTGDQELVLVRTHSTGSQKGCPILHMYQNWLVVAHHGLVHVWDLVTGATISEFQEDVMSDDFCINAELLCMKIWRQWAGGPFYYRVYDFSHAGAQLPAPPDDWGVLKSLVRGFSSFLGFRNRIDNSVT